MAEPNAIHADLAGYLLDGLDPQERADFERHLSTCAECQAEARELSGTASVLSHAALRVEPPPELRQNTLSAVERAASSEGDAASEESAGHGRSAEPGASAPARRRSSLRRARLPRLGLALGGTAALAAAVLLGVVIGGGEAQLAGKLEARAELIGPGSGRGLASVVELGIGRAVTLRSDDLPELDNTEEFYELWFVGPGDSPRKPNRVSGGTFHPDEQGRSRVRLTAAVDPATYAGLSITREPRDGDPSRTGPEVLGSPLSVD